MKRLKFSSVSRFKFCFRQCFLSCYGLCRVSGFKMLYRDFHSVSPSHHQSILVYPFQCWCLQLSLRLQCTVIGWLQCAKYRLPGTLRGKKSWVTLTATTKLLLQHFVCVGSLNFNQTPSCSFKFSKQCAVKIRIVQWSVEKGMKLRIMRRCVA